MKKLTMKLKDKSFLAIFITLIFFIRGANWLDPDFGWRVVGGRIFLEKGIIHKDPFTYTMPSFPWVDHAYLQSVVFFLLYKFSDMSLLSALYSAIAILALIISFYSQKEIANEHLKIIKKLLNKDVWIFGSLPFLLGLSIAFSFFGVRAQIVSWFMLAVFLAAIISKRWKNIRWLVPLLFLAWTNLHGSFFAGLSAFVIILFARALTKKADLKDVAVFLLSIGGSFINPYGLNIWREVASSLLDTRLRFAIAEWMPALMMPHLPMAVFIALSSVLVIKQKKALKLEEIFLYFFFLIQALLSRRHLPLWVIVAIPVTTKTINAFYSEISSIKEGIKRFRLAYKIALIALIILVIAQAIFDSSEVLKVREDGFYPKSAVEYLKQNKPQGQIFSDYGWGGYLILKYPEKKVFIDGRMPSWRNKYVKQAEAESAFDEYTDILEGKISYRKPFAKYGIDTVFWSRRVEDKDVKRLLGQIEDYLIDLGLMKPRFNLLDKLGEDGWVKVYEDSISVIYKK